jgi:hypothetical protein
MIIDLYTFRPLPEIFRTTFELPAWPYGEYRHVFEEFMRELSAFRYEDNEIKDGDRDINFSLNFKISNKPNYPFLAFFNKVAVSNEELKVIKWPADDQKGYKLLEKLDRDPTAQDRMAWLSWNVPGDVEIWDSERIKFTPRYEHLKDFTEKGKCYQPDDSLGNPNKSVGRKK